MTPDERDYPAAFAVLQKVRENNISLFEPSAVLDEVVGVIHRKAKKREIAIHEGQKLVELIFRLPILIQWQEDLMQEAMQTALSFSFQRVYDCFYLVVAKHQKIPLVTLDQEFLKKGKKFYREIFTPAEFLASFPTAS